FHFLAALRGYVGRRQDLGTPWLPLDEVTAQADYHYGVLRIPGKRLIGCTAMLLANEFMAWCELAIPSGMLALVYPVAYPIDPAIPWASELDALLAAWRRASMRRCRSPLEFLAKKQRLLGQLLSESLRRHYRAQDSSCPQHSSSASTSRPTEPSCMTVCGGRV